MTLRQRQLACLLSISKRGKCVSNSDNFGYIHCEDCLISCPCHLDSKSLTSFKLKERKIKLNNFKSAEILTILFLKEASND
jgi:hypothetical protein